MKRSIKKVLILSAFIVGLNLYSKEPFTWVFGDRTLTLSGTLQTESGFNTRNYLLNKEVSYDKAFVVKSKFDWAVDVIDPYGEMKVVLRNKATWGSNKSAVTGFTTLDDNGALCMTHRHDLGSRVVWLREGWFSIDLTKLFAMDLPKQEFKFGAFSFTLGRGISLGDAYAVSPGSLGFFQDFSVDQYAHGVLVSGGMAANVFGYDAYLGVLENKSTSFAETSAQTQLGEFGRQNNPMRGFGSINWVLAGRVKFDPIKNDFYKWHMEMYALYNNAPEQKIEFLGDSKSNLGTMGMAMEFASPAFEFGFDAAVNRGQQKVKGWDRNRIQKINREGIATYVYSDIYTVDPATNVVTDLDKVIYNTYDKSQVAAVNAVTRSPDSNGTQIEGTDLYNSLTRFRPPFSNKFEGYMLVADGGFWLLPKKVMVSFGGGIASGDINPNINLADPQDVKTDTVYEGFVPLQEVYTGDRVRSTFVLGGGGDLKRLLPSPNSGNKIGTVVDAFTNLIFLGFSTRVITDFWGKKVTIQPNILSYRADYAGNKYDILTARTTDEPASNQLGTEINMFSTIEFTDSLKSTFVWIVFLPGQHYRDVKGRPFTADQLKLVEKYYKSRIIPQDLPVIAADTVFGVTWLLSYSF